MCAVAALKYTCPSCVRVLAPCLTCRPYRKGWPAQRYFTQVRAMQLLVAGQGESAHHIANGGDVEL